MTPPSDSPLDSDDQWSYLSSRWQENHGNLLLLLTGLILLCGGAILTYQQTRVRRPSFPDARTLQAGRPVIVDDNSSEVFAGDPNAIEIRVTGGPEADGLVRMAIYVDEGTFNDTENAFLKKTVSSGGDGSASFWVLLQDLPERFAIASYYDADANGELTRSAFNIPSERYGFSNNARGQFGPPSFEQAAMTRPPAGARVEIQIH